MRSPVFNICLICFREDKIKRLSQERRRLQQRNDDLRETEEYLKQAEATLSSLRTKVDDLHHSLTDSYRRETQLKGRCQAMADRASRLSAKLQAERRKSCDSQEKVDLAMSTVAQLRQINADEKKRRRKSDTAVDAAQQNAQQKKRQRIKEEAVTDPVAEGAGSWGGAGGGGGAASGPTPCERCTEKGFSCKQIVLSSKRLSCEKCRGSRVGCSFRTD